MFPASDFLLVQTLQALLEAKMMLDRVNLGAKKFISKNDETWKPPTVSAVQAAAERAKAEQVLVTHGVYSQCLPSYWSHFKHNRSVC
jgi:hypothetical protein